MPSKSTTRSYPRVERTCRICLVPFMARVDVDQTFCSKSCAQRSRSTKIPRACLRCSESFMVAPNHPRRYCSRACKWGTPEQRFWQYVQIESDCWRWIGYLNGQYGRMNWYGRMTLAHRVSWEIHFGRPDDNILVLHKCVGGGNPWCVNPAHLAIGDRTENSDDMMVAGRHWSATGVWRPSTCDKSPVAILTRAQVIEARTRVRSGEYCKDIAVSMNVNKGTLTSAVNGQSWKDLLDPPPVKMKRGGGVYSA